MGPATLYPGRSQARRIEGSKAQLSTYKHKALMFRFAFVLEPIPFIIHCHLVDFVRVVIL